MKFCTQCGAQITENASFCSSCGHAINQSVPEQVIIKQDSNSSKNIIIIVIALAAIGLAIFLYNIFKVDKQTISTNTSDQVKNQPTKGINTPVVEHETNEDIVPTEPVLPTQTLRNVASPTNTIADDRLTDISNVMNDFFKQDNDENVEAILSHFDYPVTRYYDSYNLSYDELKDIFDKNMVNKLSFHQLTPYLSTSTVSFNGESYEILLNAMFEWETYKSPGVRKNKQIRLKYILNDQLKMTSAYEL